MRGTPKSIWEPRAGTHISVQGFCVCVQLCRVCADVPVTASLQGLCVCARAWHTPFTPCCRCAHTSVWPHICMHMHGLGAGVLFVSVCGCASVPVAVPVSLCVWLCQCHCVCGCVSPCAVPVFMSLQHVCVPMHSLAAGGVCVSVHMHNVTAGRARTHSPAAEGLCACAQVQHRCNGGVCAIQAQLCCNGSVSVCMYKCSCVQCWCVCERECSIAVTWLCPCVCTHKCSTAVGGVGVQAQGCHCRRAECASVRVYVHTEMQLCWFWCVHTGAAPLHCGCMCLYVCTSAASLKESVCLHAQVPR